jgi:hypothetical protein
MKEIKDERITSENNKLYAQTYWLVLFMTVIVTINMLFADRTFAIYIPIIIGSGGSLIIFFARYLYAGILFSRATDERIENFKIRTKAFCHIYCTVVYLISGVAAIHIFPENKAATSTFFIWIVPAFVVLVRSVKKGVAKTVPETKKKKRGFKIATVIGALCFGAYMTWFVFDFEGILQNISFMLLMAVSWGIPWYFLMNATNKMSDKNADKHLKQAEEESGEDA